MKKNSQSKSSQSKSKAKSTQTKASTTPTEDKPKKRMFPPRKTKRDIVFDDDYMARVNISYEDDPHNEFLDEEERLEEDHKKKKIAKKQLRKNNKENYYVDPDEMLEKIKEYYRTDVMTKELAEDIRKISTKICSSMNFANYTYRDEMEADAFFRAYMAIYQKKFDVNYGFSPFSYLSQVCHRAAVSRINTEKTEHAKIEQFRDEHYEMIKNESSDLSQIQYDGRSSNEE